MKRYFDFLDILLVEDNPGDALLIEDYLDEVNAEYNLKRVSKFLEAQAVLREHKFDVILLDLTLPDISGEELVDQILSVAEKTPVVVLTGYTNKEFGIKALSKGVSDYLLKDEYTPNELQKSIIFSIERSRVNQQLIHSEKKYRELFDLSPIPIIVFDIENLDILDTNRAALIQYGYDRETMLQKNIRDIRFEGVDELIDELEKSKNKLSLYKGIVNHQTNKGKLIKVDVRCNRINFGGKEAVLKMAFDVTEQLKDKEKVKESERKLKKLNKELEARVKQRTSDLQEANEELEMFNYAVSHELRSPLRFMNFSLNSVLKKIDKEELTSVKEILSDMSNSVTVMQSQLEYMLAFSKVNKQAINPEKFDIKGLVNEVIQSFAKEIDLEKYNISIDDLPEVYGDSALIYHVFRNLLSNAFKYSSKEANPAIKIGYENKGSEDIFFVKDNGVGFNMKHYEKLFKTFQRLHSNAEFRGNGAGLCIAQRIINKHGGKIWAEAEVNKGASFYFTLPVPAKSMRKMVAT